MQFTIIVRRIFTESQLVEIYLNHADVNHVIISNWKSLADVVYFQRLQPISNTIK